MEYLDIEGLGKVFFAGDLSASVIQIETGTTLKIMKDFAILKPDLGANVMGLHTYVDVGRDNEAKWGQFSGARHTLRAANAGCVWNPQGNVTFNTNTIQACSLTHQSELCPGALWGSCWEKLLGTGNGKNNMESTAEASALLNELVSELYRTIGIDYYDLAYFANHPNINRSQEMDYWMESNVDPKEWSNFYDQQTATSCGGIMTIAENIKLVNGYDHFNVEIDDADVNGASYTGDTYDLFDRIIAARTSKMKGWTRKNGQAPFMTQVISVTPGIFARYKQQLRTSMNNIDRGMKLFMEGENGISMPMQGVLEYDGYWILERQDWASLDALTGIVSHIAMMTAPGVLGIAGDVSPLEQYNGMGLQITRRLGPPYQGKTYFDNTFKLGTSILDHNFVVYASNFIEPAIA